MCDQRGRCGAAGAGVVLHDRRLAPRRRQPPGQGPGDDIDAPAGPERIDDPYRAVRKGLVVDHGRGGHRRLSSTRPGGTVMPPAPRDRGRAPWPPGWGIVKAHPEICSWHRIAVVRRNACRSASLPRPQLSTPRCRRSPALRGFLAGCRSRRFRGNRSPLRRGGPRSRAAAGVREECSGSTASWLNVSCWLRRTGSDVAPVCPICPRLAACPVMRHAGRGERAAPDAAGG